mmetsp:Transcript_4104/g.7208  ORF Transcript_4104/g.7208 Transcript_4104/m.7208 type:complete len:88 (+) Transcript_4104:62-325(+)
MGDNRLFVGNLAWTTTDESLLTAFSDVVGSENVSEARVILDKFSGRSRGFGFVTFSSSEVTEAALQQMNGKEIDGRDVRVDRASSRA